MCFEQSLQGHGEGHPKIYVLLLSMHNCALLIAITTSATPVINIISTAIVVHKLTVTVYNYIAVGAFRYLRQWPMVNAVVIPHNFTAM